MCSGIYTHGRDCRKITWLYNNSDNSQYFFWSGYGSNWNQYSTTYANVIIDKY